MAVLFGALWLGLGGLEHDALASATPEANVAESTTQHVVLLHGLGRTGRAMSWLGRRLTDVGYQIHNISYPSREQSVDELAAGIAAQIEACCADENSTLHFVTHSMGGIVVRALLAAERPANLGRVVMLAPPNQGTEIVDELSESKLFRWVTGPAAQQLGTTEGNAPARLGPADFELGVLTGDRSLNPITSWMIRGDDDGTVAVESAKLEGMKDFLVVDENHTFIMRSKPVAREVVHFLRHGHFSRSSLPDAGSVAASTPTSRDEVSGSQE